MSRHAGICVSRVGNIRRSKVFPRAKLTSCVRYSEQFGVMNGGSYIVPAYWQSLWNAIPQLTTGIGAWLSGPVSDRYGRRATLLVAGILSVVGVAIVYTAETSPQFLVGKMVNSVGLGAALAAGQTYVSEIAPTKIRGIALAVYTVCLVSP